MEIGGYIELDTYALPMLHEGDVALNCGRSALAYLIEAQDIEGIALPRFLCRSMSSICQQYNVNVRYYSIGTDFLPLDVALENNEWLLLVNYYGQLDNETIKKLAKRYDRLIVDNTQAYFQMPVPGSDTLYSCRKFFGVSDGGFLHTRAYLQRDLPQDESFGRMHFLLGRFERTASEFYGEYVINNEQFDHEPLKRMSKLTTNFLHGIDYAQAKQRRIENFRYLHAALEKQNKLQITMPEGPFMYPLWIGNGATLRKELQKQKIYVPTLWPNVLEDCAPDTLEYEFANNILPLPVDQRYGKEEMEYICEQILSESANTKAISL